MKGKFDMRKHDKTQDGLYRGVVYGYFNEDPSAKEDGEFGKPYVGYTRQEAQRRRHWRNHGKEKYGGKKLQDARKKYDILQFRYEVLEELTDTDPDRLNKRLREKEREWINKLDSRNNGYNDYQ